MEHEGRLVNKGYVWQSTLDPPLQPLDYAKKELDRMAADITKLKEALAEVAVEAEAAVTLIEAKDAKITELEAAGTGTGGEGPTQEEVDALTTSASTSAADLKAAVEPAAPAA
jgi:hypothetical protein